MTNRNTLLVLAAIACTMTAPLHAEEATDTISLQEVVVTGTRNAVDVRHLPMTVTVIDRRQLTEQNRTSVLPTVMQQVPGLMLTSRGILGYGVSSGAAGALNLRGIAGGGGGLLVLIDGHPQYSNIYGHPIADSYQTLMAEQVEVLRGPASVIYGSNAMGGVINIVTRKATADGSFTHINLGAGSYGTVQTQVSNKSRKGAFSSTVGVEYNRSDNHRPRMGFEQQGGFVKLGYDIDSHWNTYAEANLTRFEGSDPGTVTQPTFDRDQWITRGEATVTLENHYDRTSGALSVFTNFGNHRIDDGWNVGRSNGGVDQRDYYFRSKDNLTGVSLYQSMQLFDGNRVTAGLDYQHIYGHAYNTSKLTNEVTNAGTPSYGKSHRNEVAGYVDFRQDLLGWLTVDAGLRVDHHSTAGTELIPQVGVVVRPDEDGQLKAMVSKGYRNPTMRELYLYAMANDSLKPERIWNYELSWRQRLGKLTYGANIFYLKGDNMIQVVNRKNVNTGEIENYGAELEAAYALCPSLTLSTNHSLLHTKENVVGAPTYKGFLGLDYRQQPWTVNVGLMYIADLYTAVGDAEQKESFCLLNASVSYAVTRNLALWLRGDNLLGQKYEINQGFPMPRATFMAGVNLKF